MTVSTFVYGSKAFLAGAKRMGQKLYYIMSYNKDQAHVFGQIAGMEAQALTEGKINPTNIIWL